MNFSVTGEHRQFFRTHQWIECEAILSPSNLAMIDSEVMLVIQDRSTTLTSLPEEKAFGFGRDLWRQSSRLKKIFLQKGLAEIAAGLTEKSKLRFGYDQYFPSLPVASSLHMNLPAYRSFLDQTLCLQDMTSIQSPLCGAMLCIRSPENREDEGKSASGITQIFSRTPGNAVFFSPELMIDFSVLKTLGSAAYVLLVYVSDPAVYYKQEGDPHCHALKQLGYHFGDRLKEHLHPTVYG